LKQSSWYLIFTDLDENDFFKMEKISLKDRVAVIEQKQRVMQPGRMVFKVILKNDSYKGFDKCERVEVTILQNVVRAEVMYDAEDVQATKAPSMMQAMMEMNVDDSEDDEESDGETKETKSPIKISDEFKTE